MDRPRVERTRRHKLVDILAIVTMRSLTKRAMGCQREIAQRIVQSGADYALVVKANQGQLHESIQDLFEGAKALGFDGCPMTTLRR